MKETRVLFVGGPDWQPDEKYLADVKKKLGTTIVAFDHQKLVAAYESIKAEAVEADTEKWIKKAQRVREPAREEIVKSARFCLGLQKVLADEKAFAITINCLGLFDRGLPAYPCFGFARLNDLGLVGVCEGDLPSTMTQAIFQHMEGVPGFVTDPIFDVSNNTVIHAHCVSATKMDGPGGEEAAYEIRSHLEDHKGAVLQVKMRVGQEITMAKLVAGLPKGMKAPSVAASPADSWGANIMLLSGGKIVGIPDSESACRTKIAVQVSDARKLLENWSNGLHRVIFYGNHAVDIKRFARFTGIDVFEEC
jgi:L-fucose isomerase-like protein